MIRSPHARDRRPVVARLPRYVAAVLGLSILVVTA